MKKLISGLLFFAFGLAAADFWSKPAPEWSDKDLQKMMNNSPWARSTAIPVSGPAPPSIGKSGGGADDTAAPQPISASTGGGRGGGRGGSGASSSPEAPGGGGGGASLTIVARWQTALPIKQAAVRLKYGAKADSSDEAKQMLEQPNMAYVLVLSGTLRPLLRGNPEMLKQMLMEASSLSAKGKDALKPSDIQISGDRRTTEIVFAFPRSMPFSLDDKEVEFSTKLSDVVLKYKFKLKDMVFNSKLEM